MLRKGLVSAAAMAAIALSTQAFGREISLIQGIMQSEKNKDKLADTNAGGSNTTTVGAVYADALGESASTDFFVGALLSMKSFDAAEGSKAPGNRNTLGVNGGVRYYVPVNSQSLLPFGALKAEYRRREDGEIFRGGGYQETEESGLFYGVDVGIRGLFAEKYFIDFFIPVFESALFSTEREVTRDANGNVTEDQETTRTDLFVDARSSLVEIGIGLGMKF